MRNRKSVVRIICFALGGILFLCLMIEAVMTGREIGDALNETLPNLYIITPEDSSLISKKYIPLLKPGVVFQSKHREPVSFINFDTKYNLVIYKIIPAKNIFFKDIFKVDIKGSDRTTGELYGLHRPGNAEFQYHLNKPANTVRRIYLALSGDSIRNTIRNDSLLGYHLSCKSFSIKYAEKEPVDFVMNGKNNELGFNPRISTDLLFLYRDNVIYLLVMTPEKPEDSVRPGILFDIISGS